MERVAQNSAQTRVIPPQKKHEKNDTKRNRFPPKRRVRIRFGPSVCTPKAWSGHPWRLPGRAVEDVNHLKVRRVCTFGWRPALVVTRASLLGARTLLVTRALLLVARN